MAYDSENKTSAELEREVELQRSRVENTIDQIQERLSPGQLVDELLAYTKGGGGEFVTSLQRSVTANPLPVALIGASLAWLMAKPATSARTSPDAAWDDSINRRRGYTGGAHNDRGHGGSSRNDYPVAIVEGSSLLRTGSSKDDAGNSYSEFADMTGRKFKALSDATGKRAGHFVDEAGHSFRGFTNAAGSKIDHFRDDAGNLIDDAKEWASHTWGVAQEKIHDARDAASAHGESLGSKATEAGDALRHQAENLNQTILHQFRDQPLIGGALAFAIGAALAATLPHTPAEDAVLGEAADAVKAKATDQATELYEQGKDKAEEAYGKVTEKVGDLYSQAKNGVTTSVDQVSPVDRA